ncbi:MAG: hypothetical protein ACE5GB_02850 [Acidimicrobiales bacterium]
MIRQRQHPGPVRRRGALATAGIVLVALIAAACSADTRAETVTSHPSAPSRAALALPTAEPGPPVSDIDPEVLIDQGTALVDQDRLSECLAAGGACGAEVPGLEECMRQALICNEEAYRELQAQWAPDPAGPLPDEAVNRALSYADAALGGDVESRAASMAGTEVDLVTVQVDEPAPELRPAALGGDRTVVLAVTVHAPITNTDLPEGAEPTTHDVCTVVHDGPSRRLISICMG